MGTEATNLPKLAAPARRALQGAGHTRLEDLTKVTEADVRVLVRAMKMSAATHSRTVSSEMAAGITAFGGGRVRLPSC
jgi:hypothetical protein